MLHDEITNQVICSFYNVYNTLGYGFLEKVYENALAIELSKTGMSVAQQELIQVFYEGEQVGQYFADMLVNDLVVLELKSADGLKAEHFAQLKNYLKATECEVGLLLNFGKKPDFKRVVIGNKDKSALNINHKKLSIIQRGISSDSV